MAGSSPAAAAASGGGAPPAEATASRIQALREQAKVLVKRDDYEGAVALYDQGLAMDASDAVLLCNKSVCLRKLGRNEEALAAAEAAVAADEKHVKSWTNKTQSLQALGNVDLASMAVVQGTKKAGRSPLFDRLAKVVTTARKADATADVQDEAHFLRIFARLPNIRHRLASLAACWNAMEEGDRHQVLQALVKTVGGLGERRDLTDASQADPSQLVALPMTNYSDLKLLPKWIGWYRSQPAAQKCALFGSIWKGLTTVEEELLVKDIETFFGHLVVKGEPVGEADAAAAGSAE